MMLTASSMPSRVAIHHQRDVFEEAAEIFEILHGAHKLLQVFEPARGIGGAVLLPHLGVAAFVEHDFGQLGMRQLFALRAPALERDQQIAQRAARFGLQFVGLDHGARGF